MLYSRVHHTASMSLDFVLFISYFTKLPHLYVQCRLIHGFTHSNTKMNCKWMIISTEIVPYSAPSRELFFCNVFPSTNSISNRPVYDTKLCENTWLKHVLILDGKKGSLYSCKICSLLVCFNVSRFFFQLPSVDKGFLCI